MLENIYKKGIKKIPEFIFGLGQGTGLSIKELIEGEFELSWAQINFPIGEKSYSDDDVRTSYRIWLNYNFRNNSQLTIRINKHVQLTSHDFCISHEQDIISEKQSWTALNPKPEFEEDYDWINLSAVDWVVKIYVKVNCIYLPNLQENLFVKIDQKKSGLFPENPVIFGSTKIIENRGDTYVLKVTGPFKLLKK